MAEPSPVDKIHVRAGEVLPRESKANDALDVAPYVLLVTAARHSETYQPTAKVLSRVRDCKAYRVRVDQLRVDFDVDGGPGFHETSGDSHKITDQVQISTSTERGSAREVAVNGAGTKMAIKAPASPARMTAASFSSDRSLFAVSVLTCIGNHRASWNVLRPAGWTGTAADNVELQGELWARVEGRGTRTFAIRASIRQLSFATAAGVEIPERELWKKILFNRDLHAALALQRHYSDLEVGIIYGEGAGES